ncbi:MAG: hypothetical protein KY467_06895 [Gemmatimonadetes bacterium]|nr:hypothetical protein [Gemmatimonadota bacterium]
MRTLALAALAAVLIATPAFAQQGSDGLTGTRVRVTAPQFIPEPVTGTVTSYTQQGIVVADELTGDSILLPLRSVSRLDKFAGGSAASTAWYRGRVGAFIGAGLGLIAGPVLAKVVDREMGEMALIGGGAGLVSGFAVGAMVGAASPRERWTWTIQPWGYDPTLRPAAVPPVPPVPGVQPQVQVDPQPQSPPPSQPQPQTPPPSPPAVQP